MTQPRRADRRAERSILESPWLATLLALVVVALAAVIMLPGLIATGVLPGASPTASVGPFASPTPPPPSFVRPTPSPQPSFASYVVQKGDTLNSIARKFRTTARSMAWWNRGAHPSLDPESASYNPNNLKVGWVLRVLPDSVVDEDNPPPAVSEP